ncbi:hypothetical protein DE146DRAFT_782230 [Phaeosphaeria sp. MPI-PUGE-AT-0046c]|nr:hypothetical protein DE146DRAFT_782230 [Phaeosphaeria sp. MPI-PUGE-AT-0046c]
MANGTFYHRNPYSYGSGDVEKDARKVRQHKDSMQRYISISADGNLDRYLNPEDGKLSVLKVQLVPGYKQTLVGQYPKSWRLPDEINPWTRGWTAYTNAPRRIIRWTFGGTLSSRKSDTEGEIYYKYPVASIALLVTVLTGALDGEVFMGGRYMPVRYEYFCYPKDARNKHENQIRERYEPELQMQTRSDVGRLIADRQETFDGVFARHLRPRLLCIISDKSEHPNGYELVNVDDWDRMRGKGVSGGYVFVSYTRAQFQTYHPFAPKDERRNDKGLCRSLDTMYATDLGDLIAIGTASAKDAGLCAFWIDVLCLGHHEAKQDSHRICDIARGCDRMVIALKDQAEARYRQHPTESLDALLQNWASRLWTVPELLLAPTKHDFDIYHVLLGNRSSTRSPTETIPKRNMAERAYDNGMLMRQLVDHFESNVHLTQTELLSIGLECLLSRQFSEYYSADLIYALMTLARRRPVPAQDQTVFEAFAQLSLLNDSNLLLERLMCMLPPVRGTDWTHIKDFWDCKLWDIVPSIQVAAITPNDSVLIDGAFGASIEWDTLRSIPFLKRATLWRTVSNAVMRMAPIFVISGIIALSFTSAVTTGTSFSSSSYSSTYSSSYSSHSKRDGSNSVNNPAVAFGVILFVIGIVVMAFLPIWVLGMYRGKFWGTQAHLIGLEGVADIEWLEQQLFGISQGRLKWAANGSTQSRHQQKNSGEYLEDECEATAPSVEPLPQARADLPPDHLFTIVDTYAMTAMVIRAVHPPTVALVCGQEGGMRRTLLCSYDYKTQTFHRETVVRMPTKVLDRMDRVNKFRFSMNNMPVISVAGVNSSTRGFDEHRTT